MLSGGTEKVKNAVTETGIRDSATTSIVNTLLDLGKRLRKREPGQTRLTESEVLLKLQNELNDVLADRAIVDAINPLLGMKGIFCTNKMNNNS